MKYKRILFIRASLETAWVGAVNPPIGIAYLIAALKEHGCECKTIDTMVGITPDLILDEINTFKPELIGVSMLTFRYKDTYSLIRKIKEGFSNLPIIVGGAHVSTMREMVLKECNYIDYGFVRDSEESIVEFCQGIEPGKIKGILHRSNGNVIFTGERNYSSDIDSIKWPREYGIELERYLSKELLILSSRGCPYSCIFCPVSLAIGKALRTRSSNSVVDEIEYWYKLGYRKFQMLDDNFTFYKDRTIEICNEIKRRRLDDITFRCGNGIRADRVDKEVLQIMQEVGFVYVSYGVESGNDGILKRLKKGETLEQIENAIKASIELGYDVTLFFVIGSPGETLQDVEDSIEVALKYPILDVRFYNLIPYPGTELYKWAMDNDYFVRKPEEYLNDSSGFSEYPVFETPEFTYQQRVDIFKKLNDITKTIRKKAIKRKFSKLGNIGLLIYYLFGNIYISDRFQRIVRQNKTIRRMADFVYVLLTQKSKVAK